MLLFDDLIYNDPSHTSAIDRLHADISELLIKSSQEFIKERVAHRGGQVAGWKEYCGTSHAEVQQAFLHWASCSKSWYSPTFDHMRRTRPYLRVNMPFLKNGRQ